MKEKKTTSPETDVTVLPIVPGTIILSAIMFVSFLVLLVVLNLNQMIHLPSWMERILGTEEKIIEGDTFSEEFLKALQGKEYPLEGQLLYIPSDNETLLPFLLNATPADAFYQSYSLTRTDGTTKNTQQIFRIVSGTKEHTEMLSDGQLVKIVTSNSDLIRVTEQDQTRIFPRTADSAFTPESELGLPSITRMQRMLRDAEEGKYILSLSSSENTTSIRAEFTDTLSGTREVYEILPDCGVIFAAASYFPGDDAPYYTLTTTSLLTDITGFDESVFDIPNP